MATQTAANTQTVDAADELEGWKEIAAALRVSIATAKRYARHKAGRAPLPTYLNLRGFRAIRRPVLERWYAVWVLQLDPGELEAPPASAVRGPLAA